MKRLHQGLVTFITIYLCASALVGCARPHNVSFKTQTCIIPTKNFLYKTCSDIDVFIEGETYVIPKNFQTDLASIPRIFWSFIPPQFSAYVAPAILHDYLYHCYNTGDRKWADDLFYASLISQGANRFTAEIFYIAVRIFGSEYYNADMQNCLGYDLG